MSERSRENGWHDCTDGCSGVGLSQIFLTAVRDATADRIASISVHTVATSNRGVTVIVLPGDHRLSAQQYINDLEARYELAGGCDALPVDCN
jgi:hypothetical protein